MPGVPPILPQGPPSADRLVLGSTGGDLVSCSVVLLFLRRHGGDGKSFRWAVTQSVTMTMTCSTLRPFQLFAVGRNFDVDGFLAATGLHCDRVFRRGERYGRGDWIQDSSGFNRWIDESTLSLEQQFEVAARFLEQNRDALSRLGAWPGLQSATLVVSPEVEAEPSILCTKLYAFPLPLVQSCAALGLELGLALRLKWPDESRIAAPNR